MVIRITKQQQNRQTSASSIVGTCSVYIYWYYRNKPAIGMKQTKSLFYYCGVNSVWNWSKARKGLSELLEVQAASVSLIKRDYKRVENCVWAADMCGVHFGLFVVNICDKVKQAHDPGDLSGLPSRVDGQTINCLVMKLFVLVARGK